MRDIKTMNLNPFNNTDKRQQIVNADNSQDENRASLVADIARLKQERADELEPLNTKLMMANTALNKAKKAFELAQEVKQSAEQSVHRTKGLYTTRLARIEKQLLSTVPPGINGLIEQIKNEQREVSQRPPPAPVSGFNAKAKERSTARNLRILDTNDRLELLRASIAKAEGLRLSSGDVITTGIAKIRTTLDMPPIQ